MMPGVSFREFRRCRIETEGPLEGASRLASSYSSVLMQKFLFVQVYGLGGSSVRRLNPPVISGGATRGVSELAWLMASSPPRQYKQNDYGGQDRQ
jgi:hypothetical protein